MSGLSMGRGLATVEERPMPATGPGHARPPALKRMLRVPEVASLLGVSRAIVYHWISLRKIPFTRVAGRVVRFDPDVLASWLHEATGARTRLQAASERIAGLEGVLNRR